MVSWLAAPNGRTLCEVALMDLDPPKPKKKPGPKPKAKIAAPEAATTAPAPAKAAPVVQGVTQAPMPYAPRETSTKRIPTHDAKAIIAARPVSPVDVQARRKREAAELGSLGFRRDGADRRPARQNNTATLMGDPPPHGLRPSEMTPGEIEARNRAFIARLGKRGRDLLARPGANL